MKKVFVSAAVAAALLALTSCNKDELRCWEITQKTTVDGIETSVTGYMWDSQNHLEVYIEDAKSQAKAAGVTLEITYKKASKYKNQVDCEVQNSENSGCFTAGTKITLADGTIKPIEDITTGDIIRTFDHEKGIFSSAKVCLTYKGDSKKRALELHFASGRHLSVVGSHDLLAENTLKYVRINKANAEGFVGKRFYNAELQCWDLLEGYTMSINKVDFYCIYSESHLNCIAEGMLTVPDDADYILNIYKLDENLKADAEQLNADIEKYGLLDIERYYPQYIEFKEQMEALMYKYQLIALGKGLMTMEDFVGECRYWSAIAV